MIEFRTLGTLSLTCPDVREVQRLLSQPRRLALLAYLAAATPRGLHRRDRLVALFWPEHDQEHARAALRQSLHVIRTALGAEAVVSRGDEEIGLDFDAVWSDVATFDAAAHGGRWSEALDTYGGELLDGFHIDGAPDFEQWLDGERARLQQSLSRCASARLDELEAGGDLAAALACAERAARLEPRDEALVRRRIALLDRAGDRARAIAAYDTFARRLQEDLEVAPAPETQELVAAIRARAPTPSVPAGAAAGAAGAAAGMTSVAAVPSRLHPAPGRGVRWAVAAGITGTLAIAAGIAWSERGRSRPDPRRVVVAPFANRTGDTLLDPLGELVADGIRRGLAQTGLLDVADPGIELLVGGPRATGGARAAVSGADGARALAVAGGAGTAVWGTIDRHGDSLAFAANVSDVRAGTVLVAGEPVMGAPGDPRPTITTLRRRVTAALATALDPKLNEWVDVASQPPSFEAYQAFRAGVHAWYDGLDASRALPHFHRAYVLDTSFVLSLVWAAWAYRGRGWCDSTLAVGQRLSGRLDGMARLERLLLEIEVAQCRGDNVAAYRFSQDLMAALPRSELVTALAGRDALVVNHPREVVALLEPLHPDRGALREHTPYHLFLTSALHLLGEHERELAAARRARRLHPNNLATLRMEVLALTALGRVSEVNARLDEATAMPPHPIRSPAAILREAALDFAAHGHAEAARATFSRALAWFGTRPAEERATEAARSQRLMTLFPAGSMTAARALAESLSAERPDNVSYLGYRGALAVMTGDSAEAARSDVALRRRPALRGLTTYWRACLAAQRGARAEAISLLVQAESEGLSTPPGSHERQMRHMDPCFAGMRNYPPLQELLRPKG